MLVFAVNIMKFCAERKSPQPPTLLHRIIISYKQLLYNRLCLYVDARVDLQSVTEGVRLVASCVFDGFAAYLLQIQPTR